MADETNPINAAAARWLAREDAGPLGEDEAREFSAWIDADPRHHGAYIRTKSAWLDTARLASLASTSQLRSAPASHRRKPQRRLAAAAGIAAVLVVSGMVWLHERGQTYASEIGEVRGIELPDGSFLNLNTNTSATVRYRLQERRIALDRGEALFKVAQDPRRPFIVQANDVRVKAIGTAFTVRVDDRRTDVIVTEGVVEIERPGAPIQHVSANHHAVLTPGDSRTDIQPVTPAAVSRELAWRNGMAVFAGEPLAVAIQEINRYSRRHIWVHDPTLASQPVAGIFRANDVEAFAIAVAETFNARIDYRGNDIYLRP